MSKPTFTAVASDQHSISIYDVSNGQYQGMIFVTSGEIIGSPIVSDDQVSIPFKEGGSQFISTFTLSNRQLIKRISM